MTASGYDAASDPWMGRTDAILSEAADRLMGLLAEAVGQLRPFPAFPGALFTFGVEVEPDGVEDASIGCIVVTEQAELRELQIGIEAEGIGAFGDADPFSSRSEQLVEPELSPRQRLILAHNGLLAVQRVLREQVDAARPSAD